MLIILLILTFYPLFFTFLTSFKDNNQFFTNFWGFANPVHLENYRDAFAAIMPYLLSFAAGAMLYVVVEELIPEMSQGRHSNIGTVCFALGFGLMMVLDVALG